MIFDFDGTLVDTAPDIAASANHVLSQMGYKTKSTDEIKYGVGLGVRHLMKKLMQIEEDSTDLLKAVDLFRSHYEENLVVESKCFDGVLEMLQTTLKDLPKAIATNKPHHLTLKMLKTLSLEDFFNPVVGTGIDYPAKPAPESIHYMCQTHDVKPEEALLIGDSKVDLQTAQNAGTHFAWVDYGYDVMTKDELKEVNMVFSKAHEWRRIVQ